MKLFFKVGDVHHCSFCGKEAKMRTQYYNHGREYEDYPECNCVGQVEYEKLSRSQRARRDAIEKQFQSELEHFKSVYVAVTKEQIKQLEYEYKLARLKKEYKINDSGN